MMIMRLPGAALLLLCASVHVGAHQVDEYLQTARLSLAHGHLALELDLTPGVAVAPSILGSIDSNGDATISPLEARAYAVSVLSDVAITLDGRTVAVALQSVAVPSSEELRNGTGTIHLRAAGQVDERTGPRQLRFRNDHRPDVSAYLANALRSADRAVHVVNQTRDLRQREIQIGYSVDSSRPIQLAWLLAALGGLAVFVAARTTPRPERG